MTFDEFWDGQFDKEDAAKRALAMQAWDAALCAAQAKAFGKDGKLIPNNELFSAISGTHTWIKPLPDNQ